MGKPWSSRAVGCFVLAAGIFLPGCGSTGQTGDRVSTRTAEEPFNHTFTRLYETGRAHIGPAYACAVLHKRGAAVWSAKVAATSREGLDAARRYVEKLGIADATTFVKVRPRYSYDKLHAIRDELRATWPNDGGTGGLGFQSALNGRICPKVEVTIESRDTVTDAQEKWATDARRQYGRDRVKIRRGYPVED